MKRIASLNIQGLNSETKQRLLADDFFEKKIDFMLLQETKIKGSEQLEITSSENKKLILYNSGSKNKSLKGVAVLVKEDTKINFEAISERICVAKIKLDDKDINVISAYAPTEEETEKQPDKTEQFYNKLTTTINIINKRNPLIIGGDFNARTKLQSSAERESYKDIIGKYARNNINENGRFLIEFCKIHKLQLSNTLFKHKASHQTTWQSAIKPKNNRKNPYRFQIDYIAVRKADSLKLLDSRAYNIMRANSDHKPVILKIKIHTNTSKPKPSTKPNLNVAALQDPVKKNEYKLKVISNLDSYSKTENLQDKWNNIAKATITAANEVVGNKPKPNQYIDDEIAKLSERQKKLKQDIESTKCYETQKNIENNQK